jgi:hypothetical protein
MQLRFWHIGIALIAAFLIGGLVCRGDRNGGVAQQRADSLRVVTDSLEDRDARRGYDSLAAARQLAHIAAQNRQLAAQGLAGRRQLDSLKSLLPDSAAIVPRPLYDATVLTYQALVRVREAERDSSEATATIWQRLYIGADSSAKAWRSIALSAQMQLGTALKRSRWGCYGGLTGSLGYGFVGDRPGVGTVAGLGVTCGKRL